MHSGLNSVIMPFKPCMASRNVRDSTRLKDFASIKNGRPREGSPEFAEAEGFEPPRVLRDQLCGRVLFPLAVLKTAAISHSATPPKKVGPKGPALFARVVSKHRSRSMIWWIRTRASVRLSLFPPTVDG
jgi:hypothetical protein